MVLSRYVNILIKNKIINNYIYSKCLYYIGFIPEVLELPFTVQSYNQFAIIKFSSDENVVGKGFEIEWRAG